jgi:hypothetical protein
MTHDNSGSQQVTSLPEVACFPLWLFGYKRRPPPTFILPPLLLFHQQPTSIIFQQSSTPLIIATHFNTLCHSSFKHEHHHSTWLNNASDGFPAHIVASLSSKLFDPLALCCQRLTVTKNLSFLPVCEASRCYHQLAQPSTLLHYRHSMSPSICGTAAPLSQQVSFPVIFKRRQPDEIHVSSLV